MVSFVQKILVDSDRHELVMTEDARKRCSWRCNIWPDCFTSHQSHYCLYYNMAYDSARKWHFSDNLGDFRRSKFIWKLGDAVQNLKSPGFPERVDSTDTGALWTSLLWLNSLQINVLVHFLSQVICNFLLFLGMIM